MERGPDLEQRVLLLCPTGRDAELAAKMLREAGLMPSICTSFESLIADLRAGSGCLVIAEEALTEAAILQLQAELRDQPAWSDLPLLLLARPGDSWTTVRVMELLGNITILERPGRPAAL